MPCVQYKLYSKLTYDKVTFDGLHITVSDLKRQIISRENLMSKPSDLQITNAETEEDYTDDGALIPRNSTVKISQFTIWGATSKTNGLDHSKPSSGPSETIDGSATPLTYTQLCKTAYLFEANASEEDKIRAMMFQSTYQYHPIHYVKNPYGIPPPNYTCFHCGKKGHYIKNCTTKGYPNFRLPNRLWRNTGIPRSFNMEVGNSSMKGAMLTNSGKHANPTIAAEAHATGKREKCPSSKEGDPVPAELLCQLCKNLMVDAVVIPCCGNMYCDACIRKHLLFSDQHVCPTLHPPAYRQQVPLMASNAASQVNQASSGAVPVALGNSIPTTGQPLRSNLSSPGGSRPAVDTGSSYRGRSFTKSQSRSCSPTRCPAQGCNLNNRSRSRSHGRHNNQSRPCSHGRRRDRSRSRSHGRRRDRSRSRSHGRRRDRSRSRSHGRRRDRASLRSDGRHRDRSRSRSHGLRRDRSRLCSDGDHQSRTGCPTYREEKSGGRYRSRSRSPGGYRSHTTSKKPASISKSEEGRKYMGQYREPPASDAKTFYGRPVDQRGAFRRDRYKQGEREYHERNDKNCKNQNNPPGNLPRVRAPRHN